jgi:heptosyltransferase-1
VPVAASLRAAFPDASISWIVRNSFRDAIRAHPAIDEVIGYSRRQVATCWWSPSAGAATWSFLASLRGRFDLVIDAQGLFRSGLMTFATGARRRIGFADAREVGWFGLNERIRVGERHAVERMLGLLAGARIPTVADARLFAPADSVESWERLGRELGAGTTGTRYALLAPTSRWTSKEWPAERWRELATALLDRGFESIVLCGSSEERRRVEAARPAGAAGTRVVNTAGRTSIGELMAAIAGASLVVANDSAATHMAVGFGRPLLSLFGPTDPSESGPFRRPRSVVRSPAAAGRAVHYRDRGLGNSIMRAIAVESVLAALDRGDAEPEAGR